MMEKIEVAKKVKPQLEKEAKERQRATQLVGKDETGNYKTSVSVSRCEPKINQKSSDEAAKLVGVSSSTIERAEYVERNGTPELIEAMKNEKVGIYKAQEIAHYPKETQIEVLKQAEENKVEMSTSLLVVLS